MVFLSQDNYAIINWIQFITNHFIEYEGINDMVNKISNFIEKMK